MFILDKQFDVLAIIGKGEYGSNNTLNIKHSLGVFKAWDQKHRRFVAIKICEKTIKNENLFEVEHNVYVPLEAYILSQCHHIGIIQIYAFMHDQNHWYYVLELPDSPWNPIIYGKVENMASLPCEKSFDLFEYFSTFLILRVLETVHLSLPRIINIFTQIIRSIMYLFNAGIVHGDIKDENIVVDKNDNVKLIDFGSSYYYKPGTMVVVTNGTLGYVVIRTLLIKGSRSVGIKEM